MGITVEPILNQYTGGYGVTDIVLPEGIREIGKAAFKQNDKIKSIVIPEGVKVIGSNAFGRCTALEEVSLPDSLEVICRSAFSGCVSLKTIEIPERVTRIEPYTFFCCRVLRSAVVTEKLSFIGECAFRECDSLDELICPRSVTLDADVFKNTPIKGIISAHSSAEEWDAEHRITVARGYMRGLYNGYSFDDNVREENERFVAQILPYWVCTHDEYVLQYLMEHRLLHPAHIERLLQKYSEDITVKAQLMNYLSGTFGADEFDYRL